MDLVIEFTQLILGRNGYPSNGGATSQLTFTASAWARRYVFYCIWYYNLEHIYYANIKY